MNINRALCRRGLYRAQEAPCEGCRHRRNAFERILRRPALLSCREILLRGNETDILSSYIMLLPGCLGSCFLSPLSSGNAFRDSFPSETFGRTVYGFASSQWSYLLLDGVSSVILGSLGSATTPIFHAACPSPRPDVQLNVQLFPL